MAFRSGGFKGKGLVYSRKPKYGKTGNGSLQNGSSIIFEENEVETDDPGMHFQHELRRTSNSHTGYILKDKSNTTRSPKNNGHSLATSRDAVVDGSRPTRNAPASRLKASVNKVALASTKNPNEKPRKMIRSSPPITLSADDTEAQIRPLRMDPVQLFSDLNSHKMNPPLAVHSDLSLPIEPPRQDVQKLSEQYDNVQLQKPVARRSFQIRKTTSTVKAKEGLSSLAQPPISCASPRGSRGKRTSETLSQHRSNLLLGDNEEDILENARIFWGVALDDEEEFVENESVKDEYDVIRNENSQEPVVPKSQLRSFQQSAQQLPPDIQYPLISKLEDAEHEATANKLVNIPPKANLIAAEVPSPTPLEEQTQFRFWRSPTRKGGACYVPSPTPATDMSTDDFVFQRQKVSIATVDRDIEQQKSREDLTKSQRRGKQKGKKGKNNRRTEVENERSTTEGNKWVKFMDFALTCPSDESDDELAFCKPSGAKPTTKCREN